MSVVLFDRRFFDRNALEVAPDLLGCLLLRRWRGALLACRIVETEAYLGPHDRAAHSRAGRTERNAPMWEEPGHAYVYLIYGLLCCFNAVCGPGLHPSAVLIRAAAPLPEFPSVESGSLPVKSPLHSTSGPGNLCKALRIDRKLDRADLCDPAGPLWIAPRPGPAPRVRTGPRVGVDYAGAWARRRLRFCDRDDPHVSRPRPTAK